MAELVSPRRGPQRGHGMASSIRVERISAYITVAGHVGPILSVSRNWGRHGVTSPLIPQARAVAILGDDRPQGRPWPC